MLARAILACLAILIVAGRATAEPTPEAMALAKRYVASLEYQKNFRTTMDAAAPRILNRTAKGQLSKKREAAFLEAVSETMKIYGDIIETKMAPVYAETFTEQELRDFIAFQESPAGRAMKEKMPLVSSALQQAMKDMAPQLVGEIQSRYCRKVVCEPPGGKAAKPQNS